MERWEYLVTPVYWEATDEQYTIATATAGSVEAALNKLGGEGWELIQIVSGPAAVVACGPLSDMASLGAYLKRRLP
jgi:hypothetical protein